MYVTKVGQKLHLYLASLHALADQCPIEAEVSAVHDDGRVDLAIAGWSEPPRCVTVLPPGEPTPTHHHCRWLAADAEAAELAHANLLQKCEADHAMGDDQPTLETSAAPATLELHAIQPEGAADAEGSGAPSAAPSADLDIEPDTEPQ